MTYEAELAAQRQRRAEGEQRFLDDLFGFPAAPTARTEQAVLPIPDATLQGRWEAWLATEDGARAFGEFCEMARCDAAHGFRLSAKALWERCRTTLRIEMNNSYTPLAAREAEARHPVLRGLFEKRVRHAA